MSEIDRYLNEVCWAMGGTLAEQQAMRDELRAHIRDAARDAELRGTPSNAALAAAMRDLGDATGLGHSMRGSRGSAPLRRPLVQPAGALILERRREYHLPRAPIALSFALAAVTSVTMILLYAWPG